MDLSLSTLADQVGAVAELVKPLNALIEAHVFTAARLHGDDTTVPLLARGGTKTARLWTYVRDDRPFDGTAPPAVVFRFSRDRAGEHGQRADLGGAAGDAAAPIGPARRGPRAMASRRARPSVETRQGGQGHRLSLGSETLARLHPVP